MKRWRQVILEEMERKGITQYRMSHDIAARTGASPGTIARYLRGTGDTASENVEEMLRFLGFELTRAVDIRRGRL